MRTRIVDAPHSEGEPDDDQVVVASAGRPARWLSLDGHGGHPIADAVEGTAVVVHPRHAGGARSIPRAVLDRLF